MKALISQKGFTLIEAMIAIFIITIGIVGVLQMFPLSIQTAKMAEMSTIAAQLAQEKMEEIISFSNSYDSIATGTATTTELDIYTRVTKITCVAPNLQEVRCNYSPIGNPNPIKKVEVTVYWKSPLGVTKKSLKIATLISKR